MCFLPKTLRRYKLTQHKYCSLDNEERHLVWLIENGELTTNIKNCLITATSPLFFKSIDALANDSVLRVHSCGKGDPMQSSTVGNGGPHMRGRATLVGGK